uniref:Arrestin_C domain-containing protein n=1 Tax=Rhabditophanes sp. KR3021 TaxID=114890 RepID=A0AC35U3D2_9BILA
MKQTFILDDPSTSYYPGDTISGVFVVEEEEISWEIKSIKIALEGKSSVEFIHDSETDDLNFYTSDLKLLLPDIEVYKSVLIKPGEEFYATFEFKIPKIFPATFKGNFDRIRFVLKGIVKINAEQVAKRELEIVNKPSIFDYFSCSFNDKRDQEMKIEPVGCDCAVKKKSHGSYKIMLTSPKAYGYFNQDLSFTFKLFNKTSTPVAKLFYYFCREENYHGKFTNDGNTSLNDENQSKAITQTHSFQSKEIFAEFVLKPNEGKCFDGQVQIGKAIPGFDFGGNIDVKHFIVVEIIPARLTHGEPPIAKHRIFSSSFSFLLLFCIESHQMDLSKHNKTPVNTDKAKALLEGPYDSTNINQKSSPQKILNPITPKTTKEDGSGKRRRIISKKNNSFKKLKGKDDSPKSTVLPLEDNKSEVCSIIQKVILSSGQNENLLNKFFENGVRGVSREFYDSRLFLPKDHFSVCYYPENVSRNRYRDIPCLTSTRVKLSGPGNDYIHANYTSTPLSDKKFICTQAPMDETAHHFWKMVLEHESEHIIMACHFYEEGKKKCFEYYPDQVGKKLTFANIVLTNMLIEDNHSLEILEHVRVSQIKIEIDNQEKIVIKHWQMTTWPDRKVPTLSSAIPYILDNVRGSSKPTVVHCSAGIGRTGTIVFIENILNKIDNGDIINSSPSEFLLKLRNERYMAVQTDMQFLFSYRIILYYFEKMGKFAVNDACQKFYDEYETLWMKLQTQY